MTEKKLKTESLEQFLARGGKIKVVQPKVPETTQTVFSSSKKNISADTMTLWDAQIYFGEKEGRPSSAKQPKNNKEASLNLDALPEELKKRLLEKIKSANE